jgi:excinuclease UvrABC ATPase subunit
MPEMQDKPEQLDFFSLLANDSVCPICNGIFKKKSSHPHQIYCSKKCYIKDKDKEKIKEYNKRYYIKNKEKIKEYYIKNKEKIKKNYIKIKEYNKRYYNKNKEKVKERIKKCRKKWYIKNKERLREYDKKLRIKNKERLKEQRKIYYIKNKEREKRRVREYYNKNINYRISSSLRTRIKNGLFSQKTIKSKSTLELLGCSWQEAKNYIESQFKEGMTWDNYGLRGWHIDHIIPCASFDLTDPEQQKKCFHYTNLQPLWWNENLSKGAKIIIE